MNLPDSGGFFWKGGEKKMFNSIKERLDLLKGVVLEQPVRTDPVCSRFSRERVDLPNGDYTYDNFFREPLLKRNASNVLTAAFFGLGGEYQLTSGSKAADSDFLFHVEPGTLETVLLKANPPEKWSQAWEQRPAQYTSAKATLLET